ncbi:hypothetical protein K6W26_01685 [Burkholderia sp. AU42008]|uniref:hypothetical protein n=1 Tax=unclassified Burkholderia TaxID=2613784 RepID=UPI0015C5BC5B|nr:MULTISPECIES: hypothetical protein [unclassified Burkholderia]MBR8236033.1 hypothetical protein [Burkholderia sp. AU32357]MBY4871783.1 hypothetical protein [Burkholderia sp. AU42008]
MVGRLAHAEIADEGQRADGVDYAQRGVMGFGVGHRVGGDIREDGKTIIRDGVAACMSMRSCGAPEPGGRDVRRHRCRQPAAGFAIGHLTDGGKRGRLRYSAHWRSGRRRIRIRVAEILHAGRDDDST